MQRSGSVSSTRRLSEPLASAPSLCREAPHRAVRAGEGPGASAPAVRGWLVPALVIGEQRKGTEAPPGFEPDPPPLPWTRLGQTVRGESRVASNETPVSTRQHAATSTKVPEGPVGALLLGH